MLTYRKEIRHYHQLGAYNCGPVALSCLFEESLERLEKIVNCVKGTHTSEAYEGLRKEGVDCNMISLHSDHSAHLWWLEQVSYRWPIYLGCHFIEQGKRGRPRNSHHAVLIANGLIYDGNNHREEPVNGVMAQFNRKFVVKDAILFNHELKNWRNNMLAA